jgi:hypothetical protein
VIKVSATQQLDPEELAHLKRRERVVFGLPVRTHGSRSRDLLSDEKIAEVVETQTTFVKPPLGLLGADQIAADAKLL